MQRKPNLFIVGAPKCGTTSLHYYLNQHSDIFLCEPKEPNYYNTDLKRKKRITSEDYFSFFKNRNEKYIGEATPLYLMSKEAPIRIKEDSPNAKIILSIRNPVSLLFSAYHQNKYNLIEKASTFEEAINDEENRKSNLRETLTGEPIERLIYSNFVDFTNQISRYYDFFGKENVHVVIFDDLKKNTELEVFKILSFLKIYEKKDFNFSIQNQSKKHKNQLIAKIIYSPPNFFRRIARVFLSKKNTSNLYRFLKNANTKNETKPKIKEETRLMLVQRYLPEVQRLEKLLNIDLSNWKK